MPGGRGCTKRAQGRGADRRVLQYGMGLLKSHAMPKKQSQSVVRSMQQHVVDLRVQRDRHLRASEKLTFDPFPSDVPTNPFGEHRLDRQGLLESSHNVPGAGCNTFHTWRDKKDLGRRVWVFWIHGMEASMALPTDGFTQYLYLGRARRRCSSLVHGNCSTDTQVDRGERLGCLGESRPLYPKLVWTKQGRWRRMFAPRRCAKRLFQEWNRQTLSPGHDRPCGLFTGVEAIMQPLGRKEPRDQPVAENGQCEGTRGSTTCCKTLVHGSASTIDREECLRMTTKLTVHEKFVLAISSREGEFSASVTRPSAYTCWYSIGGDINTSAV